MNELNVSTKAVHHIMAILANSSNTPTDNLKIFIYESSVLKVRSSARVAYLPTP